MALDPDLFGPRLRDYRQRRGISLEAIADSTKIKLSLLVALERNDLSQWPKGISRRAFVREYAAAIGLSPEPVVAECLRLFPEDGHHDGDASNAPEADGMRLTLAAERPRLSLLTAAQALAAVADLGLVLTLGAVVTPLVGADFWTVSGLTALMYYPVATACLGQSALSWWLRRVVLNRTRRSAERVQKNTRELLHIVSRRGDSPVARARQDGDEAAAQKLRAASR
jgi:transcriptional regulator with XRE-family HTH domain